MKKKLKGIIVCGIFGVFFFFLLAMIIYFNIGIYAAEKEAYSYLVDGENVQVSKIKNGYFFDGPGEEQAIIFYPGAKVDSAAYAKLMYQIAESGKDTFLLEVPFHFAFFGVNRASDIIEQYEYKEWYLSGHSLGGVIACAYTADHQDKIVGIIALASYPSKELPKNIKYISIYGSNDKVLNQEKYEEAKQFLPKDYKEYVIEGGNHAGFGNYGKQKGDGTLQITTGEQQDYVLNIIMNEL